MRSSPRHEIERPRAPATRAGVVGRLLVHLFLYELSGALVLFAAAGTLDWPAAWIYLGLTVALRAAGAFWLLRRDPALLRERMGLPFQREQAPWDRRFMLSALVFHIGWLVMMGLDAGRHLWSAAPVTSQVAGVLLIVVGRYIVWRTFDANSYAAPVVKIQKERGHRAVMAGPYAHVRHPMYAGSLLTRLGTPLLLGSWWGLLATISLILLCGLRVVREERTLLAALDGYADYKQRVRHRLVPGLW